MTKQQIEICKKIRKYKKLNVILKKTGMESINDLLEEIPMEYLHASNLEMDDTTDISLANSAIEIVEEYCRDEVHRLITDVVAVLGFLLAVLSLILQLTGSVK